MTTVSTTPNPTPTGWFGPLIDRATWKRSVYLFATFPLGILWFVFTVTAISVGIGLAIIWVGIPILAGSFWVWRQGARFERILADQMLDIEIPTPYRPVTSEGMVDKAKAYLSDPATWRDIFYLNLLFPFGIIWFTLQVTLWSVSAALTLAPLGLALGREFGWELTLLSTGSYEWVLDTWPEAVIASALGILIALPITARLTRGAGELHGHLAKGLLQPTESSKLQARVETLTVSRDRGLDASEAERARIERDLHDGAQQRLVALAMELGMAKEKIADDPDQATELVADALENAKLAITELRDLARGIHPVVLTDRGLDAALSALAARSVVPVTVRCDLNERLPASVEGTAYFVVAESLTNIQKHASASTAEVTVTLHDGTLTVQVTDNGAGGADPAGSGLKGLSDRVASVGGTLAVTSPAGGPTVVEAELPCES